MADAHSAHVSGLIGAGGQPVAVDLSLVHGKAPTSGQLGPIAGLTDLSKLFSQLTSRGPLVKGPVTTVGSVKVVPLTDRGGTLYVATTGQPYPIEIVKRGAQAGQVTFDRFNQPVSLAPPEGAIDLSQVQSQ